MLDAHPIYGQFRGRGYGVTGIFSRAKAKEMFQPDAFQEGTSQMGAINSRPYYAQAGRSWLGTFAYLGLMLAALGNDEDDEDALIVITGGRHEENWKKPGRQRVMPNYTVRIGRKGSKFMFGYLNIPGIAIPLALIGNLNDALQLSKMEGEGSLTYKEIGERLTVSMLFGSWVQSVTMVKDMSIIKGTTEFVETFIDALSFKAGEMTKAGKDLFKRYTQLATRPLPHNLNAIRQMRKFFDPTSYSQRDIKEMLAYAMGLQHSGTNNPTLNIFGEEVSTDPGETLMPWPWWVGRKDKDPRFQFLAKYNAIAARVNPYTAKLFESDLEKRYMTSDELYDYSKNAGEKFDASLKEYMKRDDLKERVKYREERQVGKGLKELSGVQVDVDDMLSDARKDAFSELFQWGIVRNSWKKDEFNDKPLFKSKDEANKVWDNMVKYDLVFPYETSRTITIGDKEYKLNRSQIYEYNSILTYLYTEEMLSYMKNPKPKWFNKFNEDEGMTAIQVEAKYAKKAVREEADETIEGRILKDNLTKNENK